MRIAIPPAVLQILQALRAAGHPAYVVGGCVRDSLLGKTPADWDVTTAALPEQVESTLNGYPILETGLRHGTVTVLTAERPVEVTTYRFEGGYTDGRHPDSVRFIKNLHEDLRRRDFTVNAIAYHPEDGLVDPFDGQADLLAQQIRCVGNPDVRLTEDALRILRALRFSAVLSFSIEPETAAALLRHAAMLSNIAPERIAAELLRLLCGPRALPVLRDFREIIGQAVPSLVPMFDFSQNNPHHIYDVYMHTLHVVEAVPPEPVLRLAALFHDCGKPSCYSEDGHGIGHFYGHQAAGAAIAEQALRQLRLDNDTIRQVVTLVTYHDVPLEPTRACVRRWLNRLGEPVLRRLLLLKRADNLGQAPAYQDRQLLLDQFEALLQQVIEDSLCFSLKNLAVKGDDLIEIGVPSGPELGNLLSRLLTEVLEDRCPNERGALLSLANRWRKRRE